jgi:hypothetical protein
LRRAAAGEATLHHGPYRLAVEEPAELLAGDELLVRYGWGLPGRRDGLDVRVRVLDLRVPEDGPHVQVAILLRLATRKSGVRAMSTG